MNQVRIIGGRWRGRKLPVANIPGLRPTGDRVRETLFNWLAPMIDGANCLDLFAGSGALSIEALSRGAARALCLDNQPLVVSTLLSIQRQLGASGLEPLQFDAISWLAASKTGNQIGDSEHLQFDIIFLDPPFDSGLLQPTINALADSGRLKDRAWVYLEQSRMAGDITLPQGWNLIKDKRTGNIRYSLIEIDPE